MKQLTLFLMLIFIGCSPSTSSLIVGKWYVKEALFNNKTNADIRGSVIEFKDGKTLIINKENQIVAGSWKSFYDSQPMMYNDQYFDMGQSVIEILMPDSSKWYVATVGIGRKTMKLTSKKGRHRTQMVLSRM